MTDFKEELKKYQVELISKHNVFDNEQGGGLYKGKAKKHILAKQTEKNLFKPIRLNVLQYFKDNKIRFWGGEPSGNVLSSQIFCLNHLFAIRKDEMTVRKIMQKIIGESIMIDHMEKVCFATKTTAAKHDDIDPQYISFEAVSATQHLYEKNLIRGSLCTSIDALAIAVDKENGKKVLLVMEWKLVEDDTGNKAPSNKNAKEYKSGINRVNNYASTEKKNLIESSNFIKSITSGYYDSALFHLPFYELMRQTLWADLSKEDFGTDDYLHIEISPEHNKMRRKIYRLDKRKIGEGIEDAWKSLLTEEGAKKFILANSEDILEFLGSDQEEYLRTRYYSLSHENIQK